MGTVTVENMGLGGVVVRLGGMSDAQDVTDDNGQYSFRGLRAGTYSVEISGFDTNEVSFSSTSGSKTVGVGETEVISFDGTYLRTAGVQGQVTIVDSGEGLGGVTVTLLGQGEDRTEMTNASGHYAFSQLKGGTYQVAISGYDTDDYEFLATSKSVTVATGETANVPFEGTLLRTAGIAGRVSLDDGTGLDGVMVTLAGAAESSTETSNGGQYSFAGLAAGSYIVSISNPDANAYNFDDDELQKTVELMDDQSAIVNFSGTHARTASVSGMLFIDEVVQDKMYNAGEPSITEAIAPLVAAGALDQEVVAGLLAKAKVKLRGPDLNTMQDIDINADGSFSTGESLVAGTYQVELPVNDDDVAAGLAAAGVAFVGESMVVEVAAGGSATANFPFRITMQTVATGARMGGGGEFGVPVAGVKLALYARADGTGMLGEAMTDEMGAATFNFARADNIGPAGNDNIIFVRAVETGHDDLVVSGNEYVEIAYAPTSRLYAANTEMEVATLVNVHANFQFWVKSDEDARSGDMPLAGWKTVVFMGEVTDDKPLMKPDPEDDTKEVNLTDPTEDEDGELGRGTVSYMVDPAMLPAAFTVVVPPGQSSEMYEASGVLTHVHTGLEHPDMNSMEMNDLGPVYLTWSTQALAVGVYRETDDEPGWTNYQSKVDGGDQRPSEAVSAELEVELMVENSRGRLTRYEYKRFDSDGKRTIDVANPMSFGKTGTAKFPNLPADMEFTVRFHAGSDRKAVVDAESDRNGRDVDTYGGDLDDGTSIGAFGDMAGAGPEVRLCPMSPMSADDCATFAYQWATGSIGGQVTRRGAGVASATVNLDAITDNHSPSENTKTSKAAATKGDYSISAVQDGEYWVGTPATADNKADSMRVAFYHDETMDDDADDGLIGNPAMHSWSPDVTALRLEIRGFVANDGQEGDNVNPDLDQIVRGDEAVAGIALELLTITKVSTNKKDTTFKVHATTETGDDGSYVFGDVVEGSAYYVRATGSGIYVAAEASAKDGFSRKVAADEYPAVEEGEFGLPYWDYNAGAAKNTSVTVSNATGTVSADFVNFALLYSDGTISGRVREASGSPGNITIELIRCETYDADDGECSTYNRSDFPTRTTETKSNGTWEFNDLLEGWYEVYVGEAGYLAANIDDNNMIDDDASTVSDEMHTGLVKGKRDLAAGNNFYVYDNGLDDDDDLGSDGVVIKGTTDPDEDPVELTSSSDVITWASKTVTVTPDIHRDASFAARTASRGARPWPQSKGVATVEPDFNATGSDDEGMVKATAITVSVTAENGYDDSDYTYMVYRAAPVGNDLAAGDFTVEAPAGATIRADQGVVDQFTTNVAEAVEDLTFTVTLEDSDKQELAVMMGGDDVDPSDRKRADRAHEFRYELTLATGANTVDITVTSEDDVDRAYQLVVRRGVDPTLSSDATLSALALSGVTLSPTFASGTMAYTASVAHDAAAMTTVTATKNHIDASDPVITPADADANMAGHQVDISGASTTITVSVTAEDGTPGTYTVAVTRTAAPTTPTVSLTLTPSTIDEGDMSTVTATLSEAHDADVTIDVSAAPAAGSETVAGDFTVSAANNTLTIAAGQRASTGTVTITANQDDDGDDEVVTVSGSVTSPATGVDGPADVMLAITDDEEVPGVPQSVSVASGASQTLTLSWGYPRIVGSSAVTNYEYQFRPAGGSNEPTATWTSTADATINTVDVASNLIDGLEYQLFVRAVNGAGAGAHVRVAGTPWPTISSVAASPDNVAEEDLAATADNAENETTVTITMSGSAVSGFSVALESLYDDDGDNGTDPVDASGLVTLEMTEVMFGPGEVTKTVTVTAVSDDVDSDPANTGDEVTTVTISAELDEPEGEGRTASTGTFTVTDNDQVATAPDISFSGVAATQFVVSWTEATGSTSDVTSYQIRWKAGSAAGDFTDDDAWTTVNGGGNARSHPVTGLTAETAYVVQVRAVSAAGDGAIDTDTQTTPAS